MNSTEKVDINNITIIAKGNNKKNLAVKDNIQKLLPSNYTVSVKYTKHGGHATELTIQAINEGANCIIAVGGDGTVNEVVNGLMHFDDERRKSLFMGILPMGTGNDFARTAKLTKSVDDLAKLILNQEYLPIDIGVCKFTNKQKTKTTRYFNNIAEIGIGANVVQIVSNSKKRLGGTMSFTKGVVKAFVKFRKPRVKIKGKEINWSGKAVTVCFANGNYYGSGLGIAPDAILNDGKLSLVIVGDVKLVHFLRYLPKLRKMKHIKIPQIHYDKITGCQVESKKPSPIELDGENLGFTPFKVNIIAGAINLLTRY